MDIFEEIPVRSRYFNFPLNIVVCWHYNLGREMFSYIGLYCVEFYLQTFSEFIFYMKFQLTAVGRKSCQ